MKLEKLIDEEMERSPLLKALIESMPEMIFIFNEQGKLKALNNRMRKFLEQNPNISFSTLKGSGRVCDVTLMQEKCRLANICSHCFLQNIIGEVKEKKVPIYNKEGYLHINIEGLNKKISIIQNIYPFEYEGEKYIIFSFRDIENIRKYERKRIRDLKKLSLIGQSVSTIVHDLKNPLTGLMGYVELLKLKKGQDEITNKMEGAIERIRTMLEDILGLTRGEDEIFLEKSWEDIREIVFEIVRLLDLEEETHIDIRGKTLVYIDKVKIHNVIWNLLKNASEAIDKEEGEIDIKIYKSGKMLKVEVRDNGKGIKEKHKKDIFKAGKTFDKHNGTGFGLASAKRIIEAHDGTIDFESIQGEGTIFFIKIPISG